MARNDEFYTVGDVLAQSAVIPQLGIVAATVVRCRHSKNPQFYSGSFCYSSVVTHSRKRSLPKQLNSHTQSRTFTHVQACIRDFLELWRSIGTVSIKVIDTVRPLSYSTFSARTNPRRDAKLAPNLYYLAKPNHGEYETLLRRKRAVSVYCFTLDTEGKERVYERL